MASYIQKCSDGEFYVFRSTTRNTRNHKSLRNWWIQKYTTYLLLNLRVPEELKGKKLRLKVEVIKERRQKKWKKK